MALSIIERWQSGEGTVGMDAADDYHAIVSGTDADNADDEVTVVLYAAQHFALISSFGNIIQNLRRERLGPNRWHIWAEYKSPTYNRQTNDASFSFSTGGGTQHISCSRSTVAAYKRAGDKTTPTNHKGAINVSDSGIGGVDIHVPSFDFKTTFYLPPSAMSSDYLMALKSSTGKVNADETGLNVDGLAMTFQPGELLMLGCEGQKRVGFGDWELSMSWSSLPNQVDLQIGDITGIAKNGWDYLWYSAMLEVDTGSSQLPPIPNYAYVEQVYLYTPMSGLIPTSDFGLGNNQPWLTNLYSGGGGLL